MCSMLYKNPDLLRQTDLKLDEFHENIWRVYFQIIHDIIIVEKKNVIDDIIVGIYLEQHPQLKKKYEEYGGWGTISKATTYIKEEAFDGYLAELRKWEAAIQLAKRGWLDKSRMSEYVDMTAEDMYNELQVYINDIFVNVDHDVRSYDISVGLEELIDKLDAGFAVGLPYYNMPLLTQEVNGQYLGSITLVGGLSNVGKEQPISEPVLTENGWKKMGDIVAGMKVYGVDGQLHNVIGVYPQGVKDVYEVTFNDGTSTRCGLEHLWKVYTAKQRQKNLKNHNEDHYKILPLSEILKDYKKEYYNKKENRYYNSHKYFIPLCKPINFNSNINLPVDPYVLGLLIGDGGFTRNVISFTNGEKEIIDQLCELVKPIGITLRSKKYNNHIQVFLIKDKECEGKFNPLVQSLKELNLYGCDSRQKFIPDIYKYSDIESRAKLLSGIINTDGSVDRPSCTSINISTYSKRLAYDIADIARSLGYKASVHFHDRTNEDSTSKYEKEIEYTIRLMSNDWSLLSLSNKHKSLLRTLPNKRDKCIVNIEKVGSEECQCIYIDSDDHLYITKDYIVTHNTTFARTSTLPSIINNNEKIVIMINEDSFDKWQRELLVFVANSVLKYDLQKHIVRDGHFTDETRKILLESANWIRENTKNHTITVIPFKSYKTSNAIKIVKKYASMGVKYFLLDTFKLDAGRVSNNSWLEMQQHMVEINDVIKAEVLNVHIMITFQLAKGSANQRYYTQDNIGMAKNIVDTASTCIMIRNLYDDEYTGESREIRAFKLEGKSQIPVKLDREKKYQILFIVKNREGAANDFQIIIEHDMSRNTVKEIGICHVPIDW